MYANTLPIIMMITTTATAIMYMVFNFIPLSSESADFHIIWIANINSINYIDTRRRRYGI